MSGHTFFKRRRARGMRREDAVARSICRIQDFRFCAPLDVSFLSSLTTRCCFSVSDPGVRLRCISPSLSLKRLSWISRGAERGEQWVPEGRLINCAHTRLTFFFFRLPPMITTVCAKEMHHHPQQGCRGTAGDD